MHQKPRDVVCDSGTLISLTSGCLDRLLYFFTETYHVRFIIPPCVEYECVTRPLESNIHKYLFSAIRIKDAIADGALVKIDAHIDESARHLMNLANNLFYIRGKPFKLVQQGESEMLALAKSLGTKTILIDERTTRMLIEAPLKLKSHLEEEFGVSVMINKNNLRDLELEISGFDAIRSSELVMLGYEKGYFKPFHDLQKEALEAALYKMKYSGCALSFDEIREYVDEAAKFAV